MSDGRPGPEVRPRSILAPLTRGRSAFAACVRFANDASPATLLAALVLIAATAAFVWFQVRAERETASTLHMARLESALHEVNAQEWRLAAGRTLTPELERALRRARQRMSYALVSLRSTADDIPTARVERACREYVTQLDIEVELYRRGQPDAAHEHDERFVDPAYIRLHQALDQGGQALSVSVDAAQRLALSGPLVAALTALAALLWLSLRVARAAQRADRAETERREWQAGEQRYRALFDGHPEPVWVAETSTEQVLAVNAAALTFYGYSREAFLALRVDDLWPRSGEARGPRWGEREPDGLHRVQEARHHRRDGGTLVVDLLARPLVHDGRPVMLVLVRDSGARRRFEARLREAQRLETVGRLASGVAHDFNNLVTAVVGYTQLLLGELNGAGSASARGHAHEIWKAARRATALTQQLLDFGRTRGHGDAVVDVGALVGDMQSMLVRLLGEDVQVNVHVAPGTWAVRADRGRIEQVVMNLALNGRAALPRGGRLTLTVEGAPHGANPIGWVVLAVGDSGAGMDPDALARRLAGDHAPALGDADPGASLATAQSLAAECGGRLEGESAPGRGSVFRVLLPREGAAEAPAEVPSAARARPGAHAGATLLLVEDDAAVREMMHQALETFGYQVLACCDAHQALEVAARHAGPIALMITDVRMPGLNGRELAEQLGPRRPEMKVLFMSGYTDDQAVCQGVLEASVEFIGKPFEMGALEARVSDLLAARRAA